MRILVDTNVFLDYLLKRENFDDADAFFRICRKEKNRIYVTSISLRDIGYVIHQFSHNNAVAKEAQVTIYEMVSKVIGITADDAIESLYSDMADYEDSLIVESAKRETLDLIVTNNLKDFKNSDMPVLSPKQYNEISNSIA